MVEFENGFRRLVRILLGDSPAPQNVIRNKQPALAQTRQSESEHARIVFLVNVVENDVELLLVFGKKLQSITGRQIDSRYDSRLLEISAGFLGILSIAVGVEHQPASAHRSCPPDSRVSNGGAHLENCFRANHECQLMQNAADGWTNNGNP